MPRLKESADNAASVFQDIRAPYVNDTSVRLVEQTESTNGRSNRIARASKWHPLGSTRFQAAAIGDSRPETRESLLGRSEFLRGHQKRRGWIGFIGRTRNYFEVHAVDIGGSSGKVGDARESSSQLEAELLSRNSIRDAPSGAFAEYARPSPWLTVIPSITSRKPASTRTASQRHSIFNASVGRSTDRFLAETKTPTRAAAQASRSSSLSRTPLLDPPSITRTIRDRESTNHDTGGRSSKGTSCSRSQRPTIRDRTTNLTHRTAKPWKPTGHSLERQHPGYHTNNPRDSLGIEEIPRSTRSHEGGARGVFTWGEEGGRHSHDKSESNPRLEEGSDSSSTAQIPQLVSRRPSEPPTGLEKYSGASSILASFLNLSRWASDPLADRAAIRSFRISRGSHLSLPRFYASRLGGASGPIGVVGERRACFRSRGTEVAVVGAGLRAEVRELEGEGKRTENNGKRIQLEYENK
ncbi:hypothetical protein KM043_012054 [Ampulex compressa]|nr:hypothetical protein KM043_012054 [Ampulex compressa]